MTPTLLYLICSFFFAGSLAGLLIYMVRYLIAKYIKGNPDAAADLALNSSDAFPLIFAALFILLILFSYVIIAALLKIWSAIFLTACLFFATAWMIKKLLAVLKKTK